MPNFYTKITFIPTLPTEKDPCLLIPAEDEDDMKQRCREIVQRVKAMMEPPEFDPKTTETEMIYRINVADKKLMTVTTNDGAAYLFDAAGVSTIEPKTLPTEEEAMETIYAIESRVRERTGIDPRGYSVELGPRTQDAGELRRETWRQGQPEADAGEADDTVSRLGRIKQAIRGE